MLYDVIAFEKILLRLIDPYTKVTLEQSKVLKQVSEVAGRITVELVLGYPAQSLVDEWKRMIQEALVDFVPAAQLQIIVRWAIKPHAVQGGLEPLKGVRNVIAVASGKGGVGKSTTAVNLALALQAEGARVGILDADIYGPSQPTLLGLQGNPESVDGQKMEPMVGHGIQTMSVGFLIDPDQPMVWRGPMVTQALMQLLNDTRWQDLDYLIVDMPPGTGDIQLTLAQKVPVTGAIIVTTPQDLALIDARKGYRMFEKVGVPILGIVENMSTHVCSQCGHEEAIFGSGGASRLCQDFGAELLGSLPLDMSIRLQADSGRPTVVADPEGLITQYYRQIARQVAFKVALRSLDRSGRFPKIVIENS